MASDQHFNIMQNIRKCSVSPNEYITTYVLKTPGYLWARFIVYFLFFELLKWQYELSVFSFPNIISQVILSWRITMHISRRGLPETQIGELQSVFNNELNYLSGLSPTALLLLHPSHTQAGHALCLILLPPSVLPFLHSLLISNLHILQ